MNKALFFDPYLDTLGGGERYMLTLAEYLSNQGWQVDLVWNQDLKGKLITRFGLNLNRINFVSMENNVFGKYKMMRKYDLSFRISDGSVPLMFSGKNILHFQVPFKNVNGKSIINNLKLKSVNHVVCNSLFTKKFIDCEFGISSKVIYPPVEVKKIKPDKKENIVLSVGRFSRLLQSKRQDILITAFKEMVDRGLKNWKLVFIGGADVGNDGYVEELQKMANSYPIEIIANQSWKKVVEYYGKSKIFWSASGFEIDEENEPEKIEHFGIVIVEAMAAGAVPVVIGKGGAKEIIQDKKTGFLWETKEELITTTSDLIKSPSLLKNISQEVVESSRRFSKDNFYQEFEKLL
ncbi:MAG: glycosyltransferase family 4 protein [bacterium]|nr:glycosyltransferase family 4 protein [bacterium]